ncbi:uncharacterized protein LOC123629763 [Lemur catta]|uniref:uncharacterized protein LOC123623467 n=1 Tax=Lemur catta TaxID=9447 RepID=UPI001E26A144|nr:uncharacterized protein LOC123623467 [Lemur catta]XP_045395120.1 uncharacterized protein LOC123629763 [Lemur catta]
MGQAASRSTGCTNYSPLECFIKNFTDFQQRARPYGFTVNSFDLQKFCEQEWPAFGVGWPPEGSYQRSLAARVQTVVYGNPGHPDQIPYIQIWNDILADNPRWLRRCKKADSPPKAVMVSKVAGGPGEGQAGRKLYPVLPGQGEDPLLEGPPPYVTTHSRESGQSEIGVQSPPDLASPSHTRSGSQYQPPPGGHIPEVPILPLRQAPMNPGIDHPPFMIYVPFSTSDLYNWKNQNPSFSEKPQGLISLLETIFFTHQPTWDDCQQLLQVLFTSEERERIRREATKTIPGPDGQPTTDPVRIERVFPSLRPNWDPNDDEGKGALDQYRQTLLRGIRAAAKKPTNLSKVSETVQGQNEAPAAFLERLFEAYRLYTPIDPEAPENRRAINIAFATQSAPDIRRKLQRLEGFEGKLLSELVEIAQKIYNNREGSEVVQSKKMAKILVAAMGNSQNLCADMNKTKKGRHPKKGRSDVGPNQCAYCKEYGHWKKDCPLLQQKKGDQPALVLAEETE